MTPHNDAPAVGRENERLERMLEAARAMKEWPLLGIRERRMAAGMSLRELAAAVGISSVEMGEYERGVRLPTMSTAAAISRAISAASPSGTMSERDVPAERERDELPSLNDLRDWAGRWLDEHRAEAAHARRYAALLRSPEAPDDPFGTAEECEADAESADAEAAMYAAVLALLARQEAPAEGIPLSAQLSQAAAWMRVWDECQRLGMDTYGAPSTNTGLDIVLDFIRGRAAPQEAPICLQCIERAEQDIAARHYYCADELMAALRERREPVCACGETHLDRTPLAAARPAPETRTDEASWVEYDHGDPVRALAAVREIILDAHCNRSTNETDAFYDRWLVETVSGPFDSIPAMLRDHLEGLEAARIATEPSAPDGATWGDVRSGLRAELIAEGMPVTEATRLARKVVHRFTAAEATERSES